MESLCESIIPAGDQTFARARSRIGPAAAARRGHNFIENFATYIHKTTLRTDGTKDVVRLIHFEFARRCIDAVPYRRCFAR